MGTARFLRSETDCGPFSGPMTFALHTTVSRDVFCAVLRGLVLWSSSGGGEAPTTIPRTIAKAAKKSFWRYSGARDAAGRCRKSDRLLRNQFYSHISFHKVSPTFAFPVSPQR